MPELNEKLLQFIWQYRLLKPGRLFTSSGSEVTIVKTGELNSDAGPDFFNGLIRLNGIQLAGNIELHLRSSDWLRHGHTHNKSYDNIVLHVVYENDGPLEQNTSNNVEVLELKGHISEKTLARYEQLVSSANKLPCAGQLAAVPEIKFISWIERMTIERLEDKIRRIDHLFESSRRDYTQTFYTLLLRNFGFKVNGLPFELLARHLQVHVLMKHADNLLQLEALLLGTAGMLDEAFTDKYCQALQNEYSHLKNKYRLTALPKEIFKFSRLRPANFPGLRLAQFAALVHQHPEFLVSPQNFLNAPDLKKMLRIQAGSYWKNHYTLGGAAQAKKLSFGANSADNILVNTKAPFFFFYSKKLLKPAYTDLAIHLLSHAGFEKNTKTALFDARKGSFKSAADSQGIINLYDHYCCKKQCLKCGLATALLSLP